MNVICQDLGTDLVEKKPISIELDIIEEGVTLCLKVKWCGDLIEVFKLRRFQESDSPNNAMQDFANKLINEDQASIDPTSVSGAHIGKYLQRLGIKGPLEKLFIHEKTTSKVTLESKVVILAKVFPELIYELLQYLEKLNFFAWKFGS